MLEARVERDRWAALEAAFKTAIQTPEAGIVQTYLVHNKADAGVWRIMTFWSSREALNLMRSSGETPRGVLMFRAAGAEPALSIFDVVAEMPVHP
jgi:heme-degrading monooxygenase HmoA